MEKTSYVLQQRKMTRLEILEKALKDPCKRATQVKWRSGGYLYSGCESPIRAKERKVQKHPHKRPCKHGENIYPQSIKYSVQLITNPATSTFIWVGTVNTEVIFLNDFRWNPKIIQWHVCCFLKESFLSQTVTWKELEFNADMPIFCATKHDLVYVKGGVIDERETEMAAVLWHTFNFRWQILQNEQLAIPPCTHALPNSFLINNLKCTGKMTSCLWIKEKGDS